MLCAAARDLGKRIFFAINFYFFSSLEVWLVGLANLTLICSISIYCGGYILSCTILSSVINVVDTLGSEDLVCLASNGLHKLQLDVYY